MSSFDKLIYYFYKKFLQENLNIFMSFQNLNVCNSFTLSTNNILISLPSYVCSEVTIHNHAAAGQHLLIFDKPDLSTTVDTFGFMLDGGKEFTFMGVTNSNQLSCRYVSGATNRIFSGRSQYFSRSIVRQ
jgi:hypothetical protein